MTVSLFVLQCLVFSALAVSALAPVILLWLLWLDWRGGRLW
jgi:hypothetical protein